MANNESYFEQLIEDLGLDEPEIIQYNSGANLGGLTEEQRNYIISEFINGRPVYVWSYDNGFETIDTNVTLGVSDGETVLIVSNPNLVIPLQASQEEQMSES